MSFKSSEIGDKIKKIRELRNFTQEHVAQQLEMSSQGYGKIERNEVEVTIQKLENIASILDTTIYDILNFNDKVVFNNHDFNHNHFLCHTHNSNSDLIKEIYEARIVDLQKEIGFLRKLLEKK